MYTKPVDNSTFLPTFDHITKFSLLCTLKFSFFIFWVICIYPFLSLHKSVKQKWGKLPEFRLFDNARHGIKYYFSTLTVLNTILIPINLYMVLNRNSPIMVLAMLNLILTFGIAVFSVIVGVFVQVYQAMMAWELAFGNHLADQKIEKSRKTQIRILYAVFFIKDVLAKPALVASHIRDNWSLTAMKIGMQHGDMEVLKILKVVDVAIQLLVPVALILHLIKSKAGIPNSSNKVLKRLLLLQAINYSLAQLSVIVVLGINFLREKLPFEECLYLFQLVPSLIPIIIMMTVVQNRRKIGKISYRLSRENAGGLELSRF